MIIRFNKPLFLYSELKELALEQGVTDNQTVIGLWIKNKGYKRKRIMINNERKFYYYK